MKRLDPSSFKKALFGPPFLPRILIWVGMLCAVTQFSTLLSNQPAAYWLSALNADRQSPFYAILKLGPLPFGLIAVIYLALIGSLLVYLRRPLALTLFGTILFLHAELFDWATRCGWRPFLVITDPDRCQTFTDTRSYLLWIFLTGLLVLVVFVWNDKISERTRLTWRRLFIGASALWLVFLGAGLLKVAVQPATGWKPVVSQHSPGLRSLAAVAYDTKRGRAVMFGGLSKDPQGQPVYHSDTWEWDGRDWVQVQVSGGPSGRIMHTMAYDEARGVVVLYGGWNKGNPLMDVWEWDGHAWTKRCPVCNPAARYYHQMFYDPVRGQVIIYGGVDPDKVYHEAWTWNGQCWTNMSFDTQSPSTSAKGLVYDTKNQRAIGFLGQDWGETWIWQGSTWTQLKIASQPPIRDYFSMTYDPGLDRTVLFGGKTGNTWLDDTWIFKGNAWHKVQTPLSPPARTTPILFYDPVRHRVMLYGGEQSDTVFGDMWELDLP